ncbi:MAG: UDP-N-acetylmuramoyl-L-alanyl-D-glutamate--2,6-diaminopimelate ligase [Acidobacteria bacterium]|nr:UDP-N-acetylmuramoyl-L-alanyl-D-glutamate--2,6-diaminopimelate ligase [Acidobacteriota bacterium]
MLLQEVLERIPGVRWNGRGDILIGGIAYDSRLVRAGDLFVAIRGEKEDGARFIGEALSRGAAAVASEAPSAPLPGEARIVVEDARAFLADVARVWYGDPCASLRLAAVTGTKGKTTCTYLLYSILRGAGLRSCLAGTIGMKIGDEEFPAKHTTPEAPDLYRFFRRAVDLGCTHGTLEVSSHALAQKRVYGARFAVGVFMNLTHDHLDFHRTMDAYFEAKMILFTPGNRNRLETAVINIDDTWGRKLAAAAGAGVLTFGFDRAADIRVLDFQSGFEGTRLRLGTPAGEARLRSPLIGRPNAYNIMAATGAALGLGLGLDDIGAGVAALAGVPGRMQRVEGGQDFLVLVDYAHSPDSLENVLRTARELPRRRLITVFGCGGDRDRAKRPVMGAIAAKWSDRVIATSDNPRTEDADSILREIEPGLEEGPAPFDVIPDRREAIAAAVAMARSGDIVVIAGKGHEDYQIIGTRTFPFDDREVAAQCLRNRPGTAPGEEAP